MSDVVDLTNCDREPIHLLGGIQPFAFMLVLSNDWLVARASANVIDFIGESAESLIGRPVIDVLTHDAVHALRNRMTMMRGEDASERLYRLALLDDRRLFDVAVHVVDGQVLIEAEPAQGGGDGDSAGMVRAMMARLEQADGMTPFFREAARQVRALTGFDRVMVYRFDRTGSGEVVAEAARSGIGSFLNLRYPASDIPVQARRLYIRNLFRVIADIGADPVPIVPRLSAEGAPLDLSLAVSRAVSPIHVEYLKNMGVGASLSISIVVEGRLWGLFACHHYAPRLPALERRGLAELFAQMFAMKLESRERQAANDYLARAQRVSDQILAALAGDAGLLDNPGWLAEVLEDVVPCDGVGVAIGGRFALHGLTPSEADFGRLVRALNGTAAAKVYATDRIADLLPEASRYVDVAAGLLALPISRSPRDYVVLFRQEFVRTVKWGGDPHKPAELGPNGARLTPRKSFETWAEEVDGRSAPFTEAEVKVAESLRSTLIEVVLRMSDEVHAERQLATERQELLIAELNHRVRNILSLMHGLVRQSRGSASSLDDYVDELDGRIQALARAHNQITAEHWGPGALRTLIETEAAAYLADRSKRIRTKGADILLHPQAYSTMALVVHELMTNSAKYGALSDSGTVTVTWTQDDDGDLAVDWIERGGPAVQAPTRQGFGSTIIQRSIPYDLGGVAKVAFAVTGLTAHFCIPARHVDKGTAAPADTAPSAIATREDAPGGRPLSGETVLMIEDSLIIAMDAEDILTELGAARVIAAATVRQALSELDRNVPTLALLDINLGDHTSLPIAERLKAMGVPFAFATGYGDQMALPPEMGDAPILQKPYTLAGVAGMIDTLKRRPRA